jgi:hypothetical protein
MTCKLVDQFNNNNSGGNNSNSGHNWKTLYRHHSDDLSSLENLNELYLLPNQILRQICSGQIHQRCFTPPAR